MQQAENRYHIDVEVTTEYVAQQSDPAENRYLFAYYINIINRGSCAAQLLSRHWRITDGNQQLQEVQGDGVIGQQPVIPAGSRYSYNSFCVLKTPVGSMQGSYLMLADDGHRFDAKIPIFTLAIPNALN
ncbi:Co2+/Mg2+ efflux protein ApaG [Endozoicomonadaceae bacterium StTr2]